MKYYISKTDLKRLYIYLYNKKQMAKTAPSSSTPTPASAAPVAASAPVKAVRSLPLLLHLLLLPSQLAPPPLTPPPSFRLMPPLLMLRVLSLPLFTLVC